VNAFDTWSLRKVLWILYTRHITITIVMATIGCRPISYLIQGSRLFLSACGMRRFQAESPQSLYCIASTTTSLEKNTRHRRTTAWLRGIAAHIQSANTGIHSDWRKAALATYHCHSKIHVGTHHCIRR